MKRLLALFLCSFVFAAGALAASPLQVVVSVVPNKFFVEQVGGERVSVVSLVKPGETPETFNPSPRQIAGLSRADLYVRTGVKFEEVLIPRIKAVNPQISVLDLREGIAVVEESHSGEHADYDPHIWTSPKLVQKMAVHIEERLISLIPQHSAEIRQNTVDLIENLETLDKEISEILSPLKNREFIVFHPAWGNFAKAYQLKQISLEHEGKEPSARHIAEVIAEASGKQIKTVFQHPAIMHRAIDRIADALNAQVDTLDPLAEDYFTNLRSVAKKISEAGT